MSNVKNLVGQRFGSLTVISLDNVGSHGKEYLCKCDCGNEKVIRGSTLTSGKISGCGCKKGRPNKGKKYDTMAKSHIGEEHGSLRIMDIERAGKRGYLMICECECGNTVKAFYSEISSGKTISCGCHKRKAKIKKYSVDNTNSKWHFLRIDGKRINMNSGYEVMYAMILENKNIKWEYKPKSFTLPNGDVYVPNFYLPDQEEWIDVSYRKEDDKKCKIDKFKNLGYKLTVIDQQYIQREIAYTDYKFRRKFLLSKPSKIISR